MHGLGLPPGSDPSKPLQISHICLLKFPGISPGPAPRSPAGHLVVDSWPSRASTTFPEIHWTVHNFGTRRMLADSFAEQDFNASFSRSRQSNPNDTVPPQRRKRQQKATFGTAPVKWAGDDIEMGDMLGKWTVASRSIFGRSEKQLY